jgi:hypothetical protein
MRPTLFALFAQLALTFACGSEAGSTSDDGGIPADGKLDDDSTGFHFAFSEEPAEAYTVKIDHLGLSLITTVALHRSDAANCRGVNNQLGLFDLYRGFVEIQRMWADEIEAAGYPVCVIGGGRAPTEASILDYLRGIPCTSQRVYRMLPSGERIGGMTVLDLVTPDFVTIDVDEPGGFPNGRRPDDQITDLVLAMGLVDLSTMTVDQVHLNPPENDVPFPEGFPYLAPAHSDVPPRLYP